MPRIIAYFIIMILAVAVVAPGEALARNPRRTPVVEAVEKCLPAVVNISTQRVVQQRFDSPFGMRDRMFDEMFRDFRDRFHPHEYQATSLGSGVIVDPSGIIVTNEHVINRATRITVTLSDKSRYEGTLISSDPDNDLAIIKIDTGTPLPHIIMGTSSDLMIGETVLAMGNPFGLEGSVSAGVLSATNRSVRAGGRVMLENLIQSDAAINPGNSGGALVNINGELIGINTAIVGEGEGIGFALPVDSVKDVVASLLDYRLLNRTWLGITLQHLEPEIARQLGVPHQGVLVTEVEANSPATQAGLRRQDVIVEVNGKPVNHPYEFQVFMFARSEGDRFSIRYRRGRNVSAAQLAVGEYPQKPGLQLVRDKLGLHLQPLGADIARQLDVDPNTGMLVTDVEVNGPAHRSGIARGDLILRVAGSPVADIDRVGSLLEQLRAGSAVQVILYRRNALYRANITVR